MGFTLISAPGDEPVTATEAKLQCKVDVSADDALFTILIATARERAELAMGRALVSQTWDLELDRFPSEPYIELSKPPLQSVTSLKYKDTTGTLQTWATTNYVVTGEQTAPVLYARQACARINLAYGIVWPATYGQAADIIIRFVAGYGSASQVPSILKEAILLDIATLYRNRANVVTGTIVSPIPNMSSAIYRAHRAHETQVLAA